MPNIGYIFKGYDVLYGNPQPTTGAPVDPGFRQTIFNATYIKGSVTPDQKFFQPDGTNIVDCSGTCSLSFASTEIAGTKDYQSSLETQTSISGGGWGAKFSASVDYKRVSDQSSKFKSVFTHSTAQCCGYVAEIEYFTPPALSQNFLTGLSQLPTNYDEDTYMQFIGIFGTHYVSKASMGAVFGQQSTFSSKEWSKMLSTGLDIKAAASYSGFGATASGSHETDEQKKMSQTFSSASSEQLLYTIGAKPPADNKASTWIQSTTSTPAPIRLELRQLDSVLQDFEKDIVSSSTRFYTLDTYAQVKANLQQALGNYCNYLKNQSMISDCNAPGPDPPFPSADFPVAGLRQLSTTLKNIYPGKENKNEWEAIRSVASAVAGNVDNNNFPTQCGNLLHVLGQTTPSKENKKEWAAIRDEISKTANQPIVDQFWGMVQQLSITKPSSQNTKEW
eukprot:CAMPEP_0175142926 /NCGR_PEP_ID=MMETSP0087-20121206/13106_1 /TAXON_ID=136419 /ORGANISM="Unknown Unknown, Strain D1" /LENGTH=447 /DNA_ID=CAMNT_0016426855 /DNA_START=99 /DNA_END=1439 /DNA_ORIENTATION=+